MLGNIHLQSRPVLPDISWRPAELVPILTEEACRLRRASSVLLFLQKNTQGGGGSGATMTHSVEELIQQAQIRRARRAPR